MITYVALLHSIILSEGRRVVMSDLRRMAVEVGFKNPRTLVATGNLLIDSIEQIAISEVEKRLEAGILQSFGKQIDVIVRTEANWKRLIESNPFYEESQSNGSLVIVRVMREPLPNDSAANLDPWRTDPERIKVVNGDLWISFFDRPSQSRLLSQLTAKKMGAGTLRNWNTVRGLANLIGG